MNQIVISNFSVKRGSFTLSPLSLTIQKGEIFAILGRTASGKTVLLEAISGMFPGDTGNIFFDEIDIRDIPPGQRKLGLVYQDYALSPHMECQGQYLLWTENARIFQKKNRSNVHTS